MSLTIKQKFGAEDIIRTLLEERAKLTAFIWTIIRDPHASEDIFQDSVIKAFKKSEFKDRSHLLAWTRKTARNAAIDLVRRRKVHQAVLEDETLVLIEQTISQQQPDHVTAKMSALNKCVENLPERSREMLDLRYRQGLKAITVAERTNRSAEAVYKSLSRVHQALRECIENRLESSG